MNLAVYNTTATSTKIYTLSLHDALPISSMFPFGPSARDPGPVPAGDDALTPAEEFEMVRGTENVVPPSRSEEHTSELQSHSDLVCRLLLEKKKTLSARYLQ